MLDVLWVIPIMLNFNTFLYVKFLWYNRVMVRYTKNGTISEDDEEHVLANYCDLRGWIHWHVPQETYTKSWGVKMKSKWLGVKKGVCDHWVIVPTKFGLKLVAIEMKRQKGGTVSDEQYEFVEEINKVNEVQGFVARGAEEAIKIIEDVEKNNEQRLKERLKKLNTEIEHRKKLRGKSDNCPF